MSGNYGTNDEVIEAYFRGRSQPNKTSNGNVYHDGDVLYSYGSHFPLAYQLSNGWYMLNGDTYSSTTSAHQSLCRQNVRGTHFVIPFSVFRTASLDYKKIVPLDYEGEKMTPYWYKDKDGNRVMGYHHLMGSTLFKYVRTTEREVQDAKDSDRSIVDNQKWRQVCNIGRAYMDDVSEEEKIAIMRKYYDTPDEERPQKHFKTVTTVEYYLSGMDETAVKPQASFFLSKLTKPCETVGEAYEALKPPEVIQFEEEHDEDGVYEHAVKRQGEWFFIPVLDDSMVEVLNKMEKKKEYDKVALLSHRSNTKRSRHTAAKTITLPNHNGGYTLFAKGQIKHTGKEHKVVYLTGWHIPYENTEEGTWKAGGNVD